MNVGERIEGVYWILEIMGKGLMMRRYKDEGVDPRASSFPNMSPSTHSAIPFTLARPYEEWYQTA